MGRPRKYNLPTPPPTTVSPSPAEIIELTGNRKRARGTPVELVSAGPPLEIIEASAVPRLQLIIVLRLASSATSAAAGALAGARFLSRIQGIDPELRLALDPDRSSASHREVTYVLRPGIHRVGTEGRLAKVAAAARGIAAAFEGATLTRVDVVEQSEAAG
jgi:hypothetical protein